MSVNYWWTYLLGKPFDVVTDNQCLTWLQGLKEPKVSVPNKAYHPGRQNGNADTLSRFPAKIDPPKSVMSDDQLATGIGATEILPQ